MHENSPALSPIPVTVLCGFLGAGKTTLLKRILEAPNGVRFGVLVNDFGAINIDAELIAETGADQVSLANGCICCSIRDDLLAAAERVLGAEPRPDRLIIEASGVSRPLAILDALERPELVGRVVIDATVCLVDADQFRRLDYASTELAIDQAVSSDLLVFNKCDIADADDILAAEQALCGPMPEVRRIRTAFAEIPREVLFGWPSAEPVRSRGSARQRRGDASHAAHEHAHEIDHGHAHDHPHGHADEFESWSWTSERPIELEAFRAASRRFPTDVLRAKGILRVRARGEDRPAVFQLVGKRSVVTVGEGAPPRTSRLVAIARSGALDRAALAALADGCLVR